MRKVQAVIEYTFILAIVIAIFLAMQVYLARGIEGRFQDATDQMADQYGQGVSNIHEQSQASASTWEITFPGWGSPRTRTISKGFSSSSSTRGVGSLEENWP